MGASASARMGAAGAFLCAVCVAAIAQPSASDPAPVTRQYLGVLGAHESIEVTLTFTRGAVRGMYRQADGGPQGRLEGRAEASGLELQAYDPGGRPTAVLASHLPRDGVLRGTWQSENDGRRTTFSAEEVANDLPAAAALNGHYVRQDKSSGGSLDLLLLHGDRVHKTFDRGPDHGQRLTDGRIHYLVVGHAAGGGHNLLSSHMDIASKTLEYGARQTQRLAGAPRFPLIIGILGQYLLYLLML